MSSKTESQTDPSLVARLFDRISGLSNSLRQTIKSLATNTAKIDAPPAGWIPAGSRPGNYQVYRESIERNGRPELALTLKSTVNGNEFGSVMQSVHAASFRGFCVRLSAFVRCRDVSKSAGIWLQTDGECQQRSDFDAMPKSMSNASTDWHYREVTADVRTGNSILAFGVILDGSGEISVKDVRVERIVKLDIEKSGQTTASAIRRSNLLPDPTNLNFAHALGPGEGAREVPSRFSWLSAWHRHSLTRALLLPLLATGALVATITTVTVPYLQHQIAVGLIEQTLQRQISFLADKIEDGDVVMGRRGRGRRVAWLWQLREKGRQRGSSVLSPGLKDKGLQLPSTVTPEVSGWTVADKDAFSSGQDSFAAKAPDGTGYRLLRVTVLGAGRNGQDVELVVAGAEEKYMDRAIALWSRVSPWLAIALATLLGSLLVMQTLLLRNALQPIEGLRKAIGWLSRNGSATIPGRFPAEITPLVSEYNALLLEKHAMLERANNVSAELAHALKTPMTILGNEIHELNGDSAKVMRSQISSMTRVIDHYLLRPSVPVVLSTDAGPRAELDDILNDLQFAMILLYRDKVLDLTKVGSTGLTLSADSCDVEEVLGALIDNACKWCKESVRISTRTNGRSVEISIEDDGPGIASSKRAAVLKQGERLDPITPGTGVGISVVQKIVASYGGQLALGQAELGGLNASIDFPIA